MHILAIALQILLAASFLLAGAAKILSFGPPTKNWPHLHLPLWFRYVTGIVEMLAAGILLAAYLFPVLALPAAALLVATMLGAILAHARVHDTAQSYVPATILLLLALANLAIVWPSSSLLAHLV